MELPGIGIENNGHVRMGFFYELMTSGLFGGVLWDTVRVHEDYYRGWIRPDILRRRHGQLFESKACRQGHHLNLLDEQISKYWRYQVLFPGDTIWFCVWRHTFKGIMNSKSDQDTLYRHLAENTLAGVIIPFSVIWVIFKSPFFKRYKDGPWPDCTVIGSRWLNQLILDPDTALEQIDLESARFAYERRITPKRFFVEGFQILPFPFIRIFDDDYGKFAHALSEEVPF
jgi:hypothetical protein